MKPSLVVFAHVPPPDHGQSRMIAEMLQALQTTVTRSEAIEVHHVNARFSDGMADIGAIKSGKILKMLGYLGEAIKYRLQGATTLYYVPGPAKRSAILRDSVILLLLRRIYPRVIFHWHAIGQGTWASGENANEIFNQRFFEKLFQKLSCFTLGKPDLSICLTLTTQADALVVESKKITIVANGIPDPCAHEIDKLLKEREVRYSEIFRNDQAIRILFLSHGTIEKGLLDSLECVSLWLSQDTQERSIHLTLAGGVSREIKEEVSELIQIMKSEFGSRLQIEVKGFVEGAEKDECFRSHDVFLAASHWESFGLVAVEAMSWGLPLIAVLSDGLKGVLPQDYPYTAAVADPQEMMKALDLCVTGFNEAEPLKYSEQLRSHYLENFSQFQYREQISHSLAEFVTENSEP